MLGYQPGEFAPTFESWLNMLHVEDKEKALETAQKWLENKSGRYENEFRLKCKNGKFIWVKALGQVVKQDDKGNAVLMIGNHDDITEKKRNEAEIFKIKNLRSIGTLAGGIAHDFNNILTAIYGNISLALMETDENYPCYDLLNESVKSINRATRLTNQLLTFSKGGDPVKNQVNLVKLIEETAKFDLSGSNVKPHFNFPENPLNVNADKSQMHQVFSNLVINSMQASPDGGHLYISVENINLKKREKFNLAEGDYLKIVIQDEGLGIPKEHLGKIFEPYFTTKQAGNGLGLAIAYSIIKKHKGHIEIDSELGKGTTFSIYLPGTSEKEKIVEAEQKNDNTNKAKEAKILIMDDEEAIRTMLIKMLGRLGFKADAVCDGDMTIKQYKEALENNTPYDLIIMDLTIPGGMGGKQAVKEILKLDEKAKVIVSSGYANEKTIAEYSSYGFVDMIQKPYTLAKLKEIVLRVLAMD